ncbi:hypothetical protein HKBW3S33_01440, partial [Candidatus Hakubella thermalkaliphila]
GRNNEEVFDRLDDEKFLSLVFYEGTTKIYLVET